MIILAWFDLIDQICWIISSKESKINFFSLKFSLSRIFSLKNHFSLDRFINEKYFLIFLIWWRILIHDCWAVYWHSPWSDHESLDLIIYDPDLAMTWFDHVDFINRDIRLIVMLDCVTWSIRIVPYEFSLLWFSLSTWFYEIDEKTSILSLLIQFDLIVKL